MTTSPVMPERAGHVLVASPNRAIRQRILASLRSPYCRVEQACGGAEALGQMENGLWQVLFLDRQLPDLDADELAAIVRQRFPATEVVLMDPDLNDPKLAGPGPADALSATNPDAATASEWAEEPSGRLDQPAPHAVPRHASFGESIPHDSIPRKPVPLDSVHLDSVHLDSLHHDPLPGMIGCARSMQPVYHAARLLARRDTTVLITGPTGSGKELVARAIHELSLRAARNFVVVNCAAIPEPLLESELFGHTRGAFTGATASYGGRIQAAQAGTLFLDEIGEMPLSLQPKLLRFLERKEVQRLGSSDPLRVDTRIIAATNAHLPTLVGQGKFRADLYYRLATFPMQLPALRERPEDLLPLARHFLEQLTLRPPAPDLSPAVIQLLHAHPWAGNVRELQNVMERALILAEGQPAILPEHLLLDEPRFAN